MNEIHASAYRYALAIYALIAAYFWYAFKSIGLFLGTHYIPQSATSFSVVNPNFTLWNSALATVLTVIVVIAMFASEKLKEYVVDVGDELTRVSWPTIKETQKSTAVVVAMVIVSSIFLFIADFVFLKIVNLILSTAV